LGENVAELEPGSQHLEEVLQSRCFQRATTLRALLLYLWENKDKDISEYAIAVEALHRKPDFESKIDATVRVQIWRLRRFLTKYYETEGSHSTVRLTIPVGTHRIQLTHTDPENRNEPVPEESAEVESEAILDSVPSSPGIFIRNDRSLFVALGMVLVTVCLGVAGLILPSIHDRSKVIASSRLELPTFWKKFMDNGKPTRIVLSSPVFFAWNSTSKDDFLVVRDVSVNDFEKSKESPQIANLEKQRGKPRNWTSYTTASDTFASIQLARFLDGYGVKSSVSSSAATPEEIIDHENVVVFGTTNSLVAYRADRAPMTFKLGRGDSYIIDKSQPDGGAAKFSTVQESGDRAIFPGLVALLPHGNSGGRILVVQGSQTAALISYLISDAGMQEVSQAAERSHSEFFEAVILTEATATSPIQSRLVAFKPVTAESHPSVQ
jgi:hypothetical protein